MATYNLYTKELTGWFLPKSLLPVIHKDRELFLDTCVFFPLKAQYKGGVILNYKSRRVEMAAKLGISESNLRTKVNRLVRNGFCTLENGNLRFISSERFCEMIDVPYSKGVHITEFNAKEISDHIKSWTIEHNTIKQKYQAKQNYAKELKVGCHKRDFKRKFDAFIQRGEQFKGVNPNFTLSRKGVARVMNRKSATTGSRIVKRLKAKGLLTDTPRYEKVLKCSKSDFFKLRMEHEQWYLLKYVNGHLCKRTANQIGSPLNKPSKLVPFLAEAKKQQEFQLKNAA